MAKANRTGTQGGLKAGNATNGTEQARRLNQQATQQAGRAGQANYEFATELGATTPNAGASNARQANQRAMQNAASKAGRYRQPGQ